jgi:hypothetical protein
MLSSSAGDSRLRRWSRSATSTNTNSAGSINVAEPSFQRTATSTMPIAHDAAKITARFSMRPMTAAASARSNTCGPNAVPSGSPSTPARRIMPIAATSDASAHARLCTRPTFTPSSEARSALLALARNAMPMFVYRRNANSSTVTVSVATTASSSGAWKMNGEISNRKSNGAGRLCGGSTAPKKLGTAVPSPARSCARPIVATMRISRGACANRRITTNSTAEPNPIATTSANGTAIQYDQPSSTTSDTHSAAGTAPRSACAKLITRCDR